MSFASGFNSGINLTAQLRADARARRQEARQAELDEKAEKRAKIQDEVQGLQLQTIKRQMELEREVTKRTEVERTASTLALSKFNELAKALDPDDINGYTSLYAEYRPQMTDPKVLESFQNIHRVRADQYAERIGNIGLMQKAAQDKELGALANDMWSYHGISADPKTPQGISRIMGYKRWKAVNDELSKSDMTWDVVAVDGDSFNLSEQQYGQAMREVQKEAESRGQMQSLPAEQRASIYARQGIDPSDPPEVTIAKSGERGTKLDNTQKEEIDDSFTAMGLLIDADRALAELDAPTGKGVGWLVSSILEIAQQDADVADFKASIQKLIPKLARGVFGEVGVLTDADIENYKRTVASLSQTPDANKRVMAHTKALIARANRRKLESLALSGVNVSQYSKQFNVFKDSPYMVYRSMDSARKNLYGDVYRQTLRPGDRYLVWNEETRSFDSGVALTLKEYNPNYKPDSKE
jgi:hypothetical protein